MRRNLNTCLRRADRILAMHSHEICHGCPERIVCRCLQITEAQLVEALHTLELRTLKDVRRATGAGEGCTCCHAALKDYLQQHVYCASAAVCAPKLAEHLGHFPRQSA